MRVQLEMVAHLFAERGKGLLPDFGHEEQRRADVEAVTVVDDLVAASAGCGFFSNTVTSYPFLASRAAVAIPPIPAPITRAVGFCMISPNFWWVFQPANYRSL